MKKLIFTLTILIAILFVLAQTYDRTITATSSLQLGSLARSPGLSRTRRIFLIRNARNNGYTTTREGDLIYFQAENVVDVQGGKLLAGLKQLEYQCAPNLAPITVDLQFSNGRSNRISVSCLVLIKPRIVVMDEPSPEPN
jgi:hypothetical protein